MHILCALSGRYVIYYNERKEGYVYPANYSQYAFADLCEVEVYGMFLLHLDLGREFEDSTIQGFI